MGGALGFLYAFDSLYMSSMKGFYRIRDTDGDDTFDEFTLLKKLGVGYEHSAHSIIKSEDGKALYLVTGNHTRVPDGVRSLQPPVWGMDSLLTPMPDTMGHAVGIQAPAGWICRISPDGQDWNMIASGFRNPVDLALNQEGELFTFDSDLEFDIGSPWYRPTRVNHVTSASEFGWRTGSAKWPEYFADSNGAVVNVGPGSPTGISFGHHSNFPSEYQDKLFICDWTFGTIYTVEMEESGSSYTGTKTEFLHGNPLNIAAMRFGPDGHMYFVIGGRNTASKLYRIRYTGETRRGRAEAADEEPAIARSAALARALPREQRRRHRRESRRPGHSSPTQIATSATRRASPSRIRISRCGRRRSSRRSDPRRIIYASIALCRHGDKSLSGRVLDKLGNGAVRLARAQRPAWRCCAPTPSASSAWRSRRRTRSARSSPSSIPSTRRTTNDSTPNSAGCSAIWTAPQVVSKTIGLMKATQTKTVAYDKEMLDRHEYGKDILKMMSNTPNSQNIHYAYSLRRVRNGWTLEDRKYYFGWLNETLEKSGGKSFAGYIRAIRQDAIEHLPAEEAAAVSWLLGEIASVDLSKLPTPEGPPVAWTVDSAMKLFEADLRGRDFENGKKMFSAGRCVACHRFEGSGGYSGPDLGSVGNRYSIRDILVAICEPSQSISEQYQASTRDA